MDLLKCFIPPEQRTNWKHLSHAYLQASSMKCFTRTFKITWTDVLIFIDVNVNHWFQTSCWTLIKYFHFITYTTVWTQKGKQRRMLSTELRKKITDKHVEWEGHKTTSEQLRVPTDANIITGSTRSMGRGGKRKCNTGLIERTEEGWSTKESRKHRNISQLQIRSDHTIYHLLNKNGLHRRGGFCKSHSFFGVMRPNLSFVGKLQ